MRHQNKKINMIHESPDGGKTYTSRPMRERVSHNSSNNSDAQPPNHMTSIEWLENEIKKSIHYYRLIEDIESKSTIVQSNIFEQAKLLHKQEIIDAWEMGRFNIDDVGLGEQYYQETFVSKGSDETKEESLVEKMIPHQLKYNLDVMEKLTRTSPQQEISDEEIEKASYKFWNFNEHTASSAWKLGAKWYREQLKQKQNGQ
jgi:hypothetical protein